MSVAASGADAGYSPSALELAEAVREGLEARRWPPGAALGVPDPPAAPSPRPALLPYSNPLALPAHAGPGPLRRPVKFVRRVFRAFLRPWLDVQTRFNHTVIDALEQSHQAAHDHLRRLTEHLREQELWVRKLTDRLDECRFDLARLREDQEGRPGQTVTVGARARALTFVQTWLPRPPARVLDLSGGEGSCAAELAGLGYRVVSVHPRHLDQLTDGEFDAAVAVALGGLEIDRSAAAAIERALRPGGRLLLVAPFDPNRPDQLLTGFRRVETACAARAGAGWELVSEAPAAAAPGNALALVAAEKG
jgi:hypothetical protein